MRVWRVCRERYAEKAYSGEGAALFGGRWNPIGIPMAYSSLSLSLAVLEVFVHMRGNAPPEDFVSIAVDLGISEDQVERIDLSRLPSDWRRLDHPDLPRIGAEWIESNRSPVLLVPSVVVDGEWNALIHPQHPLLTGMRMEEPKPFRFDVRMFDRPL